MKALVIDDSKFQRLAIQRALVRAGHDVITADDGEAGLRAAAQSQPEVVILDMMLPKVTGVDVLRTLRSSENTQSIPVIILTGLSEKNRDKLIAEGATAFVEKSTALAEGDCAPLLEVIGGLSRARTSR